MIVLAPREKYVLGDLRKDTGQGMSGNVGHELVGRLRPGDVHALRDGPLEIGIGICGRLAEVDWLGASCGGYLALRAAAFEPRIKHVIAFPATTVAQAGEPLS